MKPPYLMERIKPPGTLSFLFENDRFKPGFDESIAARPDGPILEIKVCACTICMFADVCYTSLPSLLYLICSTTLTLFMPPNRNSETSSRPRGRIQNHILSQRL